MLRKGWDMEDTHQTHLGQQQTDQSEDWTCVLVVIIFDSVSLLTIGSTKKKKKKKTAITNCVIYIFTEPLSAHTSCIFMSVP